MDNYDYVFKIRKIQNGYTITCNDVIGNERTLFYKELKELLDFIGREML